MVDPIARHVRPLIYALAQHVMVATARIPTTP